ncbi:UBA domain-containing protein, partial [Dysosmobacter welbionis]
RRLRPGGGAAGRQSGIAGAGDQALCVGPADGLHRVGADLCGVCELAQVRLGCGVAAL